MNMNIEEFDGMHLTTQHPKGKEAKYCRNIVVFVIEVLWTPRKLGCGGDK